MLRWYQVEGKSPEALDHVMKSLRKQRLMVRRQNGNLFACVNTDHQKWLTRVCSDFNSVARVLEQAPPNLRVPSKEVYQALCGEELYDPILYSHHVRLCKKCQDVKRTGREAEVRTTPHIEPDTDFNLDGVIKSVEATRDRLYAQIEVVDGLLSSLSGYRDTKAQLDKLSAEVKERREAVKLLVSRGNF